MDLFLDEDFGRMEKLKQDLEQDDEELKALLNKKHLSKFELDALLNQL